MQGVKLFLAINLCWLTFAAQGQYLIQGHVENIDNPYNVFLSKLDEWNEFNFIEEGMIIRETSIDSLGNFTFRGNELPLELGVYRLHFVPMQGERVTITPQNNISFVLSNNDSISFTFQQLPSLRGETKLTSSLAENDTFLRLKNLQDSVNQLMITESNANRVELFIEKRDQQLNQIISNGDNGLVNMYALALLKRPFADKKSFHRKVLDELNDPSIRESYYSSLNKLIGSHEYKQVSKENGTLKLILGISAFINLLVLGHFLRIRNKKKTPASKLDSLTSKERQILDLIGQHLTNKEIAKELHVSDSTVKTHINNIYRKTGITSRKEAYSLAKE